MSAPVLTSVLIAAAMLYEHREVLLVSSYDAQPEQWDADDEAHCGAYMMLDENRVNPIGAARKTNIVAAMEQDCSR